MKTMVGAPVSRHYWWLTGLRGLFAVAFGLIALLLPRLTLLVLVYLFGAYAIVGGVTAVIASLEARRYLRRWWVLLLEGLVGIAAGVVAFAWPGITALALLYLIAFWSIVIGVFEVSAAFSGLLPMAQEWTLALAGVLSVLFGVLLIFLPAAAGILSLIWLIGVYALVFGVVLIIRAFQYRSAGTAAGTA